MGSDVRSMKRYLEDAGYKESLHLLFDYYNNHLQEIFELATIESNGVRPEHLENEIYSAFHHINRSLFDSDTIDDAKQELSHALNSHLKRVEYDSYKIVLNAILVRS